MFWLTFTFCTLSTPWENESDIRTYTCGHLGDVRGFYLIVLKNGSCKFYYFVDNLQTISLWNCGLWWVIGVYGTVCKTPFSCFMNRKNNIGKTKRIPKKNKPVSSSPPWYTHRADLFCGCQMGRVSFLYTVGFATCISRVSFQTTLAW